MRSIVQEYAVVAYDVATSQPITAIWAADISDATVAQQNLAAVYTPPQFDVTITLYYVLLNKNTVGQLLTTGFIGSLLGNPWISATKPEKEGINSWSTDNPSFITSPRPDNTYSPSVKPGSLKKTNDFTGAQTLFDAFLALPNLAAKFRKAGRVRDAGIVTYAYDQIVAGIWAITQGLQYIDDNVTF